MLSAHAMRHFTWGVAAGSGIDVTSHDMSTINIDAFSVTREAQSMSPESAPG